MKRAILAAFAALFLLATPVFGLTILKAEAKAPTIVGAAAWGGTISYDFKDRNGQLVAHHHCMEVYAFNADGGIVHGPVLQEAFLAVGDTVTLDAWPASSWGYCSVHLLKLPNDGVGHSDLWYLIPPQ